MLTPLLICSLLKDVSLPNHHHGKVVVSVAMRPCMQLLALEEVAPPPLSPFLQDVANFFGLIWK